eukprot:TRINITY_DN11434_c0_g1_i1.p1 TRINITY_DN11434_c0_g1~~TRINITY_DN11434_c0_g1_i1.p1  ORF type:complete len:116 (-),score=34.18 TRINITY_DN11434_c0_g1_i1:20-367(-)
MSKLGTHARGGKTDKFDWEAVDDKWRDNYLGHAVMKKGVWWEKSLKKPAAGGTAQQSAAEELAAIKRQEEELRLEALGIRPQKKRMSDKNMGKLEMAELLKKGEINTEELIKLKI